MKENDTRRLEGGDKAVDSIVIEIEVPSRVQEEAESAYREAVQNGLSPVSVEDYVMDQLRFDWE